MSGFVYAIGIEGTPLVKIGFARDVAKRLAAMQTGLPYTLVVLHQEQVEEPRRVERALHDILKVVRERGEWFELPEVYFPSLFAQGKKLIEEEPEAEPEAEPNPCLRILGQAIKKARMEKGMQQTTLQELVGLSQKQMSAIELGKANPRWSTVVKIAKMLGVKLDDLAKNGKEGES